VYEPLFVPMFCVCARAVVAFPLISRKAGSTASREEREGLTRIFRAQRLTPNRAFATAPSLLESSGFAALP
jgi:hypothetical protein